MTTIASPRLASPSTPLRTPSSSRRTSLDTTSTSSPARLPLPPSSATTSAVPQVARRNRAALRDFYGLQKPATAEVPGGSIGQEQIHDSGSELDREGFDAEKYVRDMLGREGLEGVLKEEGGLVTGNTTNSLYFLQLCLLAVY